MNRRVAVSLTFAAAGLFTASPVGGQGRVLEPKSLDVFNRTVSSFKDGTRAGLHLSAAADNGAAYLRGVERANGTTEPDTRGKDVQGQGRVGVAFQGGAEPT